MKVFGLRVPFTGRRKLYGAARRSHRRRRRRVIVHKAGRYAKRGGIGSAAAVGGTYVLLKGSSIRRARDARKTKWVL